MPRKVRQNLNVILVEYSLQSLSFLQMSGLTPFVPPPMPPPPSCNINFFKDAKKLTGEGRDFYQQKLLVSGNRDFVCRFQRKDEVGVQEPLAHGHLQETKYSDQRRGLFVFCLFVCLCVCAFVRVFVCSFVITGLVSVHLCLHYR